MITVDDSIMRQPYHDFWKKSPSFFTFQANNRTKRPFLHRTRGKDNYEGFGVLRKGKV